MASKHVKRTVIMHSRDTTYNTSIPSDEIITAMTDLSTGAYKLLMYYYSRKTGWNFDDTSIAKTLDVSERTIKVLRSELIDKRYLYIAKGAIDNYFVGRRAVQEWDNPNV